MSNPGNFLMPHAVREKLPALAVSAGLLLSVACQDTLGAKDEPRNKTGDTLATQSGGDCMKKRLLESLVFLHNNNTPPNPGIELPPALPTGETDVPTTDPLHPATALSLDGHTRHMGVKSNTGVSAIPPTDTAVGAYWTTQRGDNLRYLDARPKPGSSEVVAAGFLVQIYKDEFDPRKPADQQSAPDYHTLYSFQIGHDPIKGEGTNPDNVCEWPIAVEHTDKLETTDKVVTDYKGSNIHVPMFATGHQATRYHLPAGNHSDAVVLEMVGGLPEHERQSAGDRAVDFTPEVLRPDPQITGVQPEPVPAHH